MLFICSKHLKEDLADMAESLVRITSLKRHVTTDQKGVGGLVDVAVITKGDVSYGLNVSSISLLI